MMAGAHPLFATRGQQIAFDLPSSAFSELPQGRSFALFTGKN
jgi:hypothetical protein